QRSHRKKPHSSRTWIRARKARLHEERSPARQPTSALSASPRAKETPRLCVSLERPARDTEAAAGRKSLRAPGITRLHLHPELHEPAPRLLLISREHALDARDLARLVHRHLEDRLHARGAREDV